MSDQYYLPLDEDLKTYQDLECAEVRQMLKKYGFPHRSTPKAPEDHHEMVDRAKLMQEDLDEFAMGAVDGDVVRMADALVDIVYAAKATAVMLGLPWGALWNDVHLSNLKKVRGTNKKRDQMKYDLVKPPGWVQPRTKQILIDQGLEV